VDINKTKQKRKKHDPVPQQIGKKNANEGKIRTSEAWMQVLSLGHRWI